MFLPGLKASLRNASEITFRGRPRLPVFCAVITATFETLDFSLPGQLGFDSIYSVNDQR